MFFINSRFLTQQITGVQRYAIEISRHLKRLYSEAQFISPRHVIHNDLAAYLEAVSISRLSGHVWEQFELPIFLRQERNALLLNLGNTAPLLYGNQFVTIHDLAFLRNSKWFSKKVYGYYRFLIPPIARRAKRIITVSEFSKKEIINLLRIPEHKIKVIYNGISEGFLGNKPFKDHPNEYGDYVLAMSSSDPRKNINKLISAFKKIKMGDIKLILVGGKNPMFGDTGIEHPDTPAQNIIDAGYVSDQQLAHLYRNARVFVYPSLYEGFGVPPLEAMACGCPVVVSNAASLPEVCGDAAHYVDPDHVESIAEGIHKVLNNDGLRQRLIRKGFERASLYNWEKSAKEYVKTLDEVMH